MEKLVQDEGIVAHLKAAEAIALHGGKRARPYMMTAMYEACGGKNVEAVRDVAIALELFHLFCLIHDDVIDRAPIRHGEKTVQTVGTERLATEKRRGDLPHLANGQAILTGDLFFSWAADAMRRGTIGKQTERTLMVYSKMVDDVVAGQMIDVDLMSRVTADTDLVKRKMELKTATYSFVRPLQIGLALAGGDAAYEKVLERFGKELGIAFQLQDDLLDLTSTEEKMGKPCMNDIREGQHTLLTEYFFAHANKADVKKFLTYFGQANLDQKACEEILAMMVRANVTTFAEEELARTFKKLEAYVMKAPVTEKMREVLGAVLMIVKGRKN